VQGSGSSGCGGSGGSGSSVSAVVVVEQHRVVAGGSGSIGVAIKR